jgi:hypothetical protein
MKTKHLLLYLFLIFNCKKGEYIYNDTYCYRKLYEIINVINDEMLATTGNLEICVNIFKIDGIDKIKLEIGGMHFEAIVEKKNERFEFNCTNSQGKKLYGFIIFNNDDTITLNMNSEDFIDFWEKHGNIYILKKWEYNK